MSEVADPPKKKGLKYNAREGETIGGGYIVMRRHASSGRLETVPVPFEFASRTDAINEMQRLSEACPGKTFEVWESAYTVNPLGITLAAG